MLTDNREKRTTSPTYAFIFTIKENDLQTGKGRTSMVRGKLEPTLEEALIRKLLVL